MNKQFDLWFGFFIGTTVAAVITEIILLRPKIECEKSLPRNVECVWAAPEEMKDE